MELFRFVLVINPLGLQTGYRDKLLSDIFC